MGAMVTVAASEASLDRRLVWTDTWAFTAACDEIRALGAAERQVPLDELLRLTQLALSWYRGPLLAGESTAAWVNRPRQEYRDTLVRVVTASALAAERAARHDEVIELYRRSCECEPTFEPLCFRLMMMLNRADRAVEALEAYQRHRLARGSEPEAAPSTQIQDLYRMLLAKVSPAPPGGAPARGANHQ